MVLGRRSNGRCPYQRRRWRLDPKTHRHVGVSLPMVEAFGAARYAPTTQLLAGQYHPKAHVGVIWCLRCGGGRLVRESGERPEPLLTCWPAKDPLVLSNDHDHRCGSQQTRVVTVDGVELALRYWRGGDTARAIVVVSHGFTASKDHRDVVALAESLQARELDVLAYDARGHGQSTGVSTLGHLERHDVAAAVAWAEQQHTKIVLVGASMGAIAVLAHAALATQIAGVVAVSSPPDWRIPLRPRALIAAGLARTRPGRWVAEHHMSVHIDPTWIPPQTARSLEPRINTPLAIIHGQDDRLIPYTSALATSTPVKRQATIVPDMGHAFHRASHNAINDAIDWILEQ